MATQKTCVVISTVEITASIAGAKEFGFASEQ
jgi:hypothetical protein